MTKEKIKRIILLTLFAGITIYVISNWSQKKISKDLSLTKNKKNNVAYFNENSEEKYSTFSNNSNSEDPRLKNVQLKETKVEVPESNIKDPKILRRKKILGILTEPLSMVMLKYNSFVYSGEMNVLLPNFVKDEKSYKKGKRYGDGIKIISKFIFTKDKVGNFSLYQETSCAKKSSEYNGKLFNGTLYYVDEKYYYVNIHNEIEDKKTTNKVVAKFYSFNREPLARRNFIQILRDLKDVIDFKKISSSSNKIRRYSIYDINEDFQKKTIFIKNIESEFSIDYKKKSMFKIDLDGKNQYRSRYMTGANSSYSFEMKISDIGDVKEIEIP